MIEDGITKDEAAPPPPSDPPEAPPVDPMGAVFEEFSYVCGEISPGEHPEAVLARVCQEWLGRVYAANPKLRRS